MIEKVDAPHCLTSDGIDDSEIEGDEQKEGENHGDKDLHILLVHLQQTFLATSRFAELRQIWCFHF